MRGDNHDALRLLKMTHGGRVKCIYIDPPYNTGNRAFIYNDRFIDLSDPPTQAELQTVIDKLNELILALRRP